MMVWIGTGLQSVKRGMTAAALLGALVVLTACGGSAPAASDDHAEHELTATAPAADAADADEVAAEETSAESSEAEGDDTPLDDDPETSDVSAHTHAGHAPEAIDPELFDAQFIDGMIVHHLGAVAMAEDALAESEREEVRAMAEEIIATQSEEIDQMTAWRDEWYPDLPATTGLIMDMGAMGIGTDPDKSFDQRFLEAMIDHHEGAIEMAEMALESAQNSELRTMAEEVIAVQQGEINQMRGWLAEWFDVE